MVLLFSDRIGRVVRCGFVAAERDDRNDDAQHDDQCRDEYPCVQRGFVGKLLEPFTHEVVGDRNGDDEASQHDEDVGFVEHPEDFADGCTEHFPDGDLFAAVPHFEMDDPEDTDDGDQS